MEKNFNYYKGLAEKWNKLSEDKDRLIFCKHHRADVKVVLDNDCSMMEFQGFEHLSESEQDAIVALDLEQFEHYHYWSEGCLILFEFAGIDAESC